MKITLNINPIFKAPKAPPNILFKIPKEAKSAILVKALPNKAITIIITTKVPAKCC